MMWTSDEVRLILLTNQRRLWHVSRYCHNIHCPCLCHCPAALWGLFVSDAQALQTGTSWYLWLCEWHRKIYPENRYHTPELSILSSKIIHLDLWVGVGGNKSTHYKGARKNFKCHQRLSWEKPVFVTYTVTYRCENVIYVKHALHGEKRTREPATRESWTRKNAALALTNKELCGQKRNEETESQCEADDRERQKSSLKH